ncbi:MAG: serine/threonine protein kinase, partial [Planctomycetales bacterium]|nr:serine/threonine protein kinase [Planctomycetales bacterium]
MAPLDPDATASVCAGLSEADQQRLAVILDDYLAALERGEPISPDALLSRHPSDAPYLRGYLSGLQLFHDGAVEPSLVGPDASDWRPPSQRLGEFDLVREIGRGGMGVVYEAYQPSLQRRVALKTLPFTAGDDVKHIERFRNEAQAAAQVHHPHIVPVYAVGEDRGVHFYAMQLIEGQSLAAMLIELRAQHAMSESDAAATARPGPPEERPAEEEALWCASSVTSLRAAAADHVAAVARLGMQAAHALHAAHDYGVVHRDVKPSNLLLDDAGKLWIADFGLARCREQAGLTQTGDIVGTMRYMSPEQACGAAGRIDHRTDVYSLGVTLY